METGRTVILLNLENLYESLYDVLNQVRCSLLLLVVAVNCIGNSLYYSTISTTVGTDMLTLVFRLTE